MPNDKPPTTPLDGRADPGPPGARRASFAGAWLLPAGFIVLAVWLATRPAKVPIPLGGTATVHRADVAVGPRREALGDPPLILVNGALENCNACHQIFRSVGRPPGELSYHTDIRLNHGLNNRCLNCHDDKDRERLVLHDGSTVSFSETPHLCSQCHGTVFRDWQAGTHGKTLGSWKTGSPEQLRLTCNQCHDPHSPAYPRMTPLPGPDTLRMGEQDAEAAHEDGQARSPLQRRGPGRGEAHSHPKEGKR
jgi:hypothetical protein